MVIFHSYVKVYQRVYQFVRKRWEIEATFLALKCLRNSARSPGPAGFSSRESKILRTTSGISSKTRFFNWQKSNRHETRSDIRYPKSHALVWIMNRPWPPVTSFFRMGSDYDQQGASDWVVGGQYHHCISSIYIYIPCIIMCNMYIYIYISILFIVSIISPWYSWYPQVLVFFFPPSTCRSFSTNQTTRDSLILSRPGAEERPTRGMAMHLQGQMCTKRQEFSSLTWVKDHRCPKFPLVVWWKKRSFFKKRWKTTGLFDDRWD